MRVQLDFPSEAEASGTVFALTYTRQKTAAPASTDPPPTTAGSPTAAFSDLNSLDRRFARYIQDLAALGVFSPLSQEFQPEQAVTRQEFARWLFTAHNQMYRDRPTKQIRPIAQASQPAFEDVQPGDPGFAEIQGLAEAGIIPSRLTGDTNALLFRPEAPLTRAQAIAWKCRSIAVSHSPLLRWLRFNKPGASKTPSN
ncbi:MAG: S-layer homology domain-containing protein [Spirulinaceae cyanobacterium RM2_2_10]|nr:S-layer homology domain-containing protein [Spirulinaceae cyanobacterium RM2_2_10]